MQDKTRDALPCIGVLCYLEFLWLLSFPSDLSLTTMPRLHSESFYPWFATCEMSRKPPRRGDERMAIIHPLSINACCQVGNSPLSFREVGIVLPTCSFDVHDPGKPGIPLFRKCQRWDCLEIVGVVLENTSFTTHSASYSLLVPWLISTLCIQ